MINCDEMKDYIRSYKYYKFLSHLPDYINFDDNCNLYDEYYEVLYDYNDNINIYNHAKIIEVSNKLLSILVKLEKIKEKKYD